ncbi:hypothetical protein TVAG_344070 [Trichomonas vaginalis G3]|uniref:DUF3447 domain-containing protein n=1 Tax=Trichomonas vaginalis (strain ATCC PRA-98 / G3) TaxID=412133 RepID=A2E7M8_TRIV3|nr:protein ubiquitination [Trichomonas vaginalis G3]EAY11313.1 hypothetical protein TVAG_344070 [Trichomonas vaginalis G3]KAI5523751.1 protein ubiquitination [Trichomonas vaginalis G3]|eukprot:XP_001323536.1 hypothetical protein [Trichomonas vaginalis G3]
MTSSEQPKKENWFNYSDLKPIKVFEYPDQAAKIIFGVNSKNIEQITSQIMELITTHKISIKMALYLIDISSQILVKKTKLFAELYQKISNAFSYIYEPKSKRLATLLHYQGFKFENFKPEMKIGEILDLYSTESPLYYIAWDKVDDLKSKFPNLDINQEINEITPLDCAIKYGSELCFNYLKNLGAQYTKDSEEYAVQGGNKNIFMEMIEKGKSFNNMINIALKYRHYEIADYLKSNLGQTFDSIAESMHFGNYDVASYLLSNGGNINKIYHLFLFIFIIVL